MARPDFFEWMDISPFPELGGKSRYPDSRLFASPVRGTKPQWWRTSLRDSPRQDKRRFTSVKMVVFFALLFFSCPSASLVLLLGDFVPRE